MSSAAEAGRESDEDARGRWSRAIEGVAERVRTERGVIEPVACTVEDGVVWVCYGELRIRVDEVADEADLFVVVDDWVAFDRPAGPGRLLDRDRQVVAAWHARLPGEQAMWRRAAEAVFADVAATTPLRWDWRITIREHSNGWPTAPCRPDPDGPAPVAGPQAHGSVVVIGDDEPTCRTLSFPQVWLEAATFSMSLPHSTEDLEEAVLFLAGQVQTEVVKAVHGAWPRCPRHAHALELDGARCGVEWVCRIDQVTVARVGTLGG